MQPDQHLAALQQTRDAVRALFQQDAALLARPYAPGRWSGRQVLIHIADTESVLMDRLRRILSEDNVILAAFDQDRWTARVGQDARSLADAAALFLACRATAIQLVQSMSAGDWTRTGQHTEKGPVTAERVVTMLHWHAGHHAEQTQAAVAGRVWTAA